MPKKRLSRMDPNEARYVENGLVTLLAGTRERGECPRHVIACNDFLRLGGIDGAYDQLIKLYKAQKRAFNRKEVDYPPPTTSINTLRTWGSKYDWRGRVNLYLASVEQAKRERLKGLTDLYLASPQERIEELGFMYKVLKAPIQEFHDQQVAMSKRDAEEGAKLEEDGYYSFVAADGAMVKRRIRSMPLNEIKEARNVLDDIAREMGDRRGYVPKEEDYVIQVTGDDLRKAVRGMEVYEDQLTQAWEISNPVFIGDLDELKIPEDLDEG